MDSTYSSWKLAKEAIDKKGVAQDSWILEWGTNGMAGLRGVMDIFAAFSWSPSPPPPHKAGSYPH